jgi:hypothetical protein
MRLTDVLQHVHFSKEGVNVAQEALFSEYIVIKKIERVL